MAKARTMWIHANCLEYLWDEFYLTVVYLHIRTLTRATPASTPWEAWHGRWPEYSHMREIGCRAFVLIQNQHNPKVYERSVECVLIGYDLRSKAYRCYNRMTKKIYSSYHV